MLARLSHSELRLRAATGDSLKGLAVAVVGQVTAVSDEGFTLTRWVPGCCSAEGTGVGLGLTPALLAERVDERADTPPRREDLG